MIEWLIKEGIIMPCRSDDAQRIIDACADEARRIVAGIESGELWVDSQGEWHRVGRRGFHITPTEAWREPPWKETKPSESGGD